jgi:hypothetical protein
MAEPGQTSEGSLPAGTNMVRGFGPGMSHEMVTGCKVSAFVTVAAFGAEAETQEARTRARIMSAILNMRFPGGFLRSTNGQK